MTESVESIASAYRSRAFRDGALVTLAILAGYGVVLVAVTPVAALGFVFVCSLVLYAPVLSGSRELVLTSDRPVENERSAFAGPECPLMAMERSWAGDAGDSGDDDTESDDGSEPDAPETDGGDDVSGNAGAAETTDPGPTNGGEFSYTGLKIFRRDIRYGSERTDEGLRIEVYQNDQLRTVYRVRFEATASGTRVDATAEFATRRHLRTVLLGRSRRRHERRIYEELGYEVERDDVDLTL